MSRPTVPCPCCGLTAVLDYADHPGYRLGETFDLYHCAACDTSQAHPLQSDPALYESIYSNIERVPGYQRYPALLAGVQSSSRPLEFLSSQEDIYWAIERFLAAQDTSDLRILEAGSGLGYLTYAMSAAGYDVRGVDISATAVARSLQLCDRFEQGDVVEYAASHPDEFDVVVMTELVEHIPDFERLIMAAVGSLRPGGSLLVTTPNKSSFAADAVWGTENPPIHLWWFSEQSMLALGARIGCDVRFVDFTEFNRRDQTPNRFVEPRRQRAVPHFEPVMGADGQVRDIHPTPRSARSVAREALVAGGIATPLLRARSWLQLRRHGVSRRRPAMCAIFTRRA